jgi:hypothetical protein
MARGRDSKGRFLKRGHSGSTALARRGSGSVAKRRRSGGVITVRENITLSAPRAKPRGRLRRVARGIVDNRMAIGVTVGSAAYGWLVNSPQTADLMAKIPTVAAAGPHLSRGVFLYYLNKHTLRNKYIDQVALGALAIGGFAFGKGMAGAAVGPAVIGGSIGDGDDLVGDGGYDDDEDDE